MNEKIIKKILGSTPSIYNDIAGVFQQTRKKPWPITETIKKYIDNSSSIVDIGCGSGRLSELVPDQKQYLGLDNSDKLIDLAKTSYSNRKNIKFQVCDITKSKIPVNDFNLYLLIAVIHHIPSKKLRIQTIQNIASSMPINSKIIITSWNLWQADYRKHLFNYRLKIGQYKIFNLLDAFIPWKINGESKMRYVHSLTKSELKYLLKKSGFKIDKIFYEYKGEKSHILKGKNLVAIATRV